VGRLADAYRSAPIPAPQTGWRDASLCVIDLETTGLEPSDEIVAFATVPVSGGRVHVRGARYRTVRPQRMPESETILVHGLRSEDLVDSPPLGELLDELIEAITGTALVAHVASIEKRFLGRALEREGLELRNPVIDTARLAAQLFESEGREVPSPIKLSALADELGLPVHRPHEADGDALTTAQAFLALATRLDAIEPQTIGSLSDHGRGPGPRRALRRLLRLG
jgi:DNA polymerase-3 subunit epsilon